MRIVSIGLFILLGTASTASIATGNYWACKSTDSAHKQWSKNERYQKAALMYSLTECKKNSQFPKSCSNSQDDCEYYANGVSTTPHWRCTALDGEGAPWTSRYRVNREGAAVEAKKRCTHNSKIPDTCYIDVIMCQSIDENS